LIAGHQEVGRDPAIFVGFRAKPHRADDFAIQTVLYRIVSDDQDLLQHDPTFVPVWNTSATCGPHR